MNNNILEKLGSVHMIVSSSSQSLITYQQDVKEPIALIEKSRGSYLLSMLLFLYTGLMGMGKHVPIFCALMGGGGGGGVGGGNVSFMGEYGRTTMDYASMFNFTFIQFTTTCILNSLYQLT